VWVPGEEIGNVVGSAVGSVLLVVDSVGELVRSDVGLEVRCEPSYKWQGKDECTCTYFVMFTMYTKCFPNGRDGKSSYMKGCAAFLDRIASTVEITAEVTACTDNLVLSASVCCKMLKVATAKGIETSSQVITVEGQFICNGEDAHTWERNAMK
jgi:hypothetical protein